MPPKYELHVIWLFSGIHEIYYSHPIFTCNCTCKTVNEHFVFHYTAEREAVNAAERAERKQHLREKVGDNFLSRLWNNFSFSVYILDLHLNFSEITG